MTTPPNSAQPERRPRPTRHRGPVVLRGGEPAQNGGSTTDQRLLDRRGPSDWVYTDSPGYVTSTPVNLAGQSPRRK
jgi:hypothetical protein